MRLMATVCYLPGTALPRFSAYHMQTEREEWGEIVPSNLPQCCYARILDRLTRFVFMPLPMSPMPHFAKRPVSHNELIQTCAGAARSASKSLYIEEFITCPAKTEV